MTANRLKLNADKTELISAGTRHSVDSLLHGRGPALTLGVETVDVADAVRVFRVHRDVRERQTDIRRQTSDVMQKHRLMLSPYGA